MKIINTIRMLVDIDGVLITNKVQDIMIHKVHEHFKGPIDQLNLDDDAVFTQIASLWTQSVVEAAKPLFDHMMTIIAATRAEGALLPEAAVEIYSGSARDAKIDQSNAFLNSKKLQAGQSHDKTIHHKGFASWAMKLQFLQLFSAPVMLSIFSNEMKRLCGENVALKDLKVALFANLPQDYKTVSSMDKSALFAMHGAWSKPDSMVIFIDDRKDLITGFKACASSYQGRVASVHYCEEKSGNGYTMVLIPESIVPTQEKDMDKTFAKPNKAESEWTKMWDLYLKPMLPMMGSVTIVYPWLCPFVYQGVTSEMVVVPVAAASLEGGASAAQPSAPVSPVKADATLTLGL
ncbi:hypothetical protein [Candidatus Synchoanobacter obligatus]|uniref:Uncharacterized protein n=1 Tax=Candidatus Synchoanobacter obligatus TaxID=2919597 RepID=A0ABT1L4P9_9GAMM|nr:hypothetical protein [Candidatus Synchoanobacter obligatus]MCP8351843.1 hypothetical protein [Candidatus Synchoanobacter obligatus]